MRPCRRLHIILWVPIRVIDYYDIGTGEIDTYAAGFGG